MNNQRLEIASQIAAGIFSGVPYGIEDFEQTEEMREEEVKTTKAVARLCLLMAEELIIAEMMRPTIQELHQAYVEGGK